MHNCSHHIQSKRQSAPVKKTLFTCHRTIILSIALVILNLALVIQSVTLVLLSPPLVILNLTLVILSEAKNLSSPNCILMEVSASNVLWTRLRFEQRLSRND